VTNGLEQLRQLAREVESASLELQCVEAKHCKTVVDLTAQREESRNKVLKANLALRKAKADQRELFSALDAQEAESAANVQLKLLVWEKHIENQSRESMLIQQSVGGSVRSLVPSDLSSSNSAEDKTGKLHQHDVSTMKHCATKAEHAASAAKLNGRSDENLPPDDFTFHD
jgi:hypothetical protein